jgi:tripartite-type tricarboxylate transporter receptor subunit TctC
MKRVVTSFGGGLLCLALGIFMGTAAMAQDFPNQPIRIVTWSSVGGGGDVLARQLQGPLSEAAGVAVNVVNKPGGSGAVAMEYLSSQAADGYTVLVGTASGVITPHTTGSNFSLADFKGVIRLQLDPEVLMVRSDSPWNTVSDVVAAAKADPGSVKWGGAFLGSLDSILAYQIAAASGIEFSYVPFEGGGDAMIALLGGHVPVLIGSPSEVAAQVEAGKIRLIAVATPERLESLPDLPTLHDGGLDLTAVLWRGVVAPKDTADAIVEKLHGFLGEASQSDSFLKYMTDGKILDGYLSAADYDQSIQAEFSIYGEIVAKMGVK